MFARIHSALSLATPSSGSTPGLNCEITSSGRGAPSGHHAPVVVVGSITSPSTWSGEIPASSIALRSAVRAHAPTLLSALPSQRRAVGSARFRRLRPRRDAARARGSPASGRGKTARSAVGSSARPLATLGSSGRRLPALLDGPPPRDRLPVRGRSRWCDDALLGGPLSSSWRHRARPRLDRGAAAGPHGPTPRAHPATRGLTCQHVIREHKHASHGERHDAWLRVGRPRESVAAPGACAATLPGRCAVDPAGAVGSSTSSTVAIPA